MKRLSRNAIAFLDDKENDKVLAILCVIDHPSLDVPLRITSSAIERLSVQPLRYGITSTFLSENGERNPFYFTAPEIILPDDGEDVNPATTIISDVYDSNIISLITESANMATCRLGVVMSDTPDVIEMQTQEFEITTASGNWAQVHITFKAEKLSAEPFPWVRFTKQLFPGLHR